MADLPDAPIDLSPCDPTESDPMSIVPQPVEQTPPPPSKGKQGEKAGEDDPTENYRPGQKHPEPSLDDPSRAFYESLYQQNPKSEMGLKYCIEYGLVPESQADELCQVLAKLKRDAKKKKGV